MPPGRIQFTHLLALLVALCGVRVDTVALANDAPRSIHRAVRDDDTLALRQWLSRDITLLNARDNDGLTPLHLSVMMNKKRAFDFLIASGANVQLASGPSFMKIERDDGTFAFRTSRGQWTALHMAAFANRLEMAKVLLARGARVGVGNDYGETALFLAAREGHIGMIRLLVSHGADINATPKSGGYSPLMAAVFNGHLETGQTLIANGASIDLLSAAGLGLVADVEAALRKAPSLIDGDGPAARAPLYWAASNGQFRIVQMLLARGAKTEVKDEELRTPLMIAAIAGHSGIVRLLLDQGANIKEWDRRGFTALHHAAAHNQSRVVRALLARGADTKAKDLKGRTPLEIARENGHFDIVEIITENDAIAISADRAALKDRK
ncbi:MAG: ankyrin repeat domain-containing protein [Phycisphaerae bacterium]|nr:ankyrin repeat domain-containing protein [Phycisphaerae bacterium]